MKFVDLVRVHVRAGSGGNGMIAWRREKYVPKGGPAGGDGGRGGSVVLVADPALSTLLDLRYRPRVRAPNGEPGGTRDKNGKGGDDLVVKVPVGTMVYLEPAPPESDEELAGGIAVVDDASDAEVSANEVADDSDDFDDDAAQDAADDDEPAHDDEPTDDDEHVERRDGAAAPSGELIGDLSTAGQTLVVAQGGKGGRGNIHFRSATRQAPEYAEPGEPGDEMWLRLELKLLADVGIVGFPNVGKSTLIGKISRARPKIADYPFTTLVPQLGVVFLGEGRQMVVADVPGLIEGASEGKGLGLQFLRHLERTRVLLHLLAPDFGPDRDFLRDLDVLEAELAQYGDVFANRPRVVALNKLDLLGDREGRIRVAALRKALREREIPLFTVCAHTGEGTDALLEALWRRLEMARRTDS
ncbi:MAG: GTPase ObgE [Deltaproteobacteria bacterium]|nr:GTPase ObgE [Nannocystaceae bacterium]